MGRCDPAVLPCHRVNDRVSPTRRRSAARQTPARYQRQDQPFSRRNRLVPLLPYPGHENSGLSGTWSCRHRRRTASGGPPLGASAAVAAVPLRCQPRRPPDDPEDRPRSTVPRLSRVLPRNTRLAGRRPAAPCALSVEPPGTPCSTPVSDLVSSAHRRRMLFFVTVQLASADRMPHRSSASQSTRPSEITV